MPIATDNDRENLAVTLDMEDAADVAGFLAFLADVGLVSSDGEKVWSDRMNKNALRSGASRAQRVRAVNRRWGKE